MEESIRISIEDTNDVTRTPQRKDTCPDEGDSGTTGDQSVINGVTNYPPEYSYDSSDDDPSDSEDSSGLFRTDSTEYDFDISNNGRAIDVDLGRGVGRSFHRELLDYFGSLFNASSRIQSMDDMPPITISDAELGEYEDLRDKVDREMKILGVGCMSDVCSSDQSVARNLYLLLAARERGDWGGCRRCLRVVPMWTFETSCEHGPCDESVEIVTDGGWGCAAYVCGNIGMTEEAGAVEVDRGETLLACGGVASAGITEGYEVGARIPSRDRQCEEGEMADDVECGVRGDTMTERRGGGRDESMLLPERQGGGMSVDKLDSDLECTTEMKEFNKLENYPAKRGIDSRDGDTLSNIAKRIKYDLKKCSSSVKPTVLKQVARVGQKDIKSAIYGSRWSVRRLGLEARFATHAGCVNALHFNSSGDWIASGSDDREVVITDWQNNKQLSRFSVGHSSNIFQVRFLPGSRDLELVTCGRDKSVRYAALSSTGQLQYSRILTKHGDSCHKMDVPLDQPKLVISVGEDCKVLWSDVRTHRSSGQLCVVDKVPLYSVSCNPVRSQELCVAGKDNRVYIFDRRSATKPLSQLYPEQLAEETRVGYYVTSVVYSNDGNSVLASYSDDDIYLLSARPGQGAVTQHRYVGHRNVQTVTGVAFYGPMQEYIVSGSNDGHVLLWERESEALINWFLADEAGVVNVLEPHPFMPVLATSGLDHDVKLWSMLAADRQTQRDVTVNGSLIEHELEISRIDVAWRTLAKSSHCVDAHLPNLPFNLRDLQMITALNWKNRSESCPYTFENTLDNLISMRRRHGESQIRNLFISDSDSDISIESAPNDTGDYVIAVAPNPDSSSLETERGELVDRHRPDGCRPL